MNLETTRTGRRLSKEHFSRIEKAGKIKLNSDHRQIISKVIELLIPNNHWDRPEYVKSRRKQAIQITRWLDGATKIIRNRW